jgi:four helix bundle protein
MVDFKALKVWQKAHEMTLHTYRVTAGFPQQELHGLTSQLRRATASIGANVAEGCGCRSDGEMCRFLQIARGSASEAEYHFLLARDLRFLEEQDFQKLASGRAATYVDRTHEQYRISQKCIGGESQLVAPS